jgi:hypothetical protein
MKKAICAGAVGLLLSLPNGFAYSQEYEMEKAPRAREGRPPMPMPMPRGDEGRGIGQRGRGMMLQLMRDNPKLAGMMMQMRGEMMRIRGEEMSKMGDVLNATASGLKKRAASKVIATAEEDSRRRLDNDQGRIISTPMEKAIRKMITHSSISMRWFEA